MKNYLLPLLFGVGVGLGACADDPTDANPDTTDARDTTDADDPDARPGDPDAEDGDTGSGDTSDASDAGDTEVTVPAGPASHRAIGGMSMGAAALIIALENPTEFDFVGALGGYSESVYMMTQMLRLQFGGFCPLEDLLEMDLEDPDSTCGPAPALRELEVPMDFNRLRYDDNGITMTRQFYGEIIDNYSAAYGNLTAPAHPDAPLLPAGIDLEWWRNTNDYERCTNPKPLDPRYSFNAEYNPEGAFPVIPLCDITAPETEGFLPSWLDSTTPRLYPIDALAAIDINGNGRRDFGEPLLLNPWERFEDVGVDGCPDPYEDGEGGCLDAPLAEPGTDPNGDNFHWIDNPDGTEGNDRYDEGEPFEDHGLDGVPESVSGFADEGEGNGVWDASSTYRYLLSQDAVHLIRQSDPADLEGMSFWIDAGIRDVLNAGVVARNIVAALRSQGRDPVVYKNFTSQPDALFPDHKDDTLLSTILDAEHSVEALGRDIYIEYGKHDATELELRQGDGKHVGTNFDAINRITAFLLTSMRRFEGDTTPADASSSYALNTSFYSESMQSRRSYTIVFPPGYDEPEYAEMTFPTVYFLHGLGQDAADLAPAALVTGWLMSEGAVPKSILAFPDGGCCFVDTETGFRECACSKGRDGFRECVEPTCQGPEESCETRMIPVGQLVRECRRGSLYADMVSTSWGDAADTLNYKSSVMELVRHIEETYRVRPNERD